MLLQFNLLSNHLTVLVYFLRHSRHPFQVASPQEYRLCSHQYSRLGSPFLFQVGSQRFLQPRHHLQKARRKHQDHHFTLLTALLHRRLRNLHQILVYRLRPNFRAFSIVLLWTVAVKVYTAKLASMENLCLVDVTNGQYSLRLV